MKKIFCGNRLPALIFKKTFLYAVIITFFCSFVAKQMAGLPYLKVIGALVISLLIGMSVQFIPRVKELSAEGMGYISNKFLRAGIILLGFKLNLVVLAGSGIRYLIIGIVIVAITIFVNYGIMKKIFKIDGELSVLSACGCGICGAAAVIGIGPQLKAKQENQVLAVAVVAIMGTLFTLLNIWIFKITTLTHEQFGVMSGASLHEIAHAVAAGNAAGKTAEQIAILTKLSRVLMLAPTAFLIGIYSRNTKGGAEKTGIPVPYFMAGFLFTSVLGSFLPIPEKILGLLVNTAYILLGMAMAALGTSVNFKVIRERGGKIFPAAFIGSLIQLGICFVIAKNFF